MHCSERWCLAPRAPEAVGPSLEKRIAGVSQKKRFSIGHGHNVESTKPKTVGKKDRQGELSSTEQRHPDCAEHGSQGQNDSLIVEYVHKGIRIEF
jgi:hypothetical protein